MAKKAPVQRNSSFPHDMQEFLHRFGTEESCRNYLAECRWRDGFECPRCGHDLAYFLEARGLWKCRRCRTQTSATAGTVMHRSQQPVQLWFHAAYLVASQSAGISARELQRRLGIKRYETAWSMLKRLRQGMAPPLRDRLTGTVEVDEALVGLTEDGGPIRLEEGEGPRRIIAAAEVRGRGIGCVRMAALPDLSAGSLVGFVQSAVAPGVSTVLTDDLLGYQPLTSRGYEHHSVVPPGSESAVRALPRVHRVFSEFTNWLRATYQGVGTEHLDDYLDEFVFRFNRRGRPGVGFETLLGLSGRQDATVGRSVSHGESTG